MSPSAWSESIVERIEEAEKKLLKVRRQAGRGRAG